MNKLFDIIEPDNNFDVISSKIIITPICNIIKNILTNIDKRLFENNITVTNISPNIYSFDTIKYGLNLFEIELTDTGINFLNIEKRPEILDIIYELYDKLRIKVNKVGYTKSSYSSSVNIVYSCNHQITKDNIGIFRYITYINDNKPFTIFLTCIDFDSFNTFKRYLMICMNAANYESIIVNSSTVTINGVANTREYCQMHNIPVTNWLNADFYEIKTLY